MTNKRRRSPKKRAGSSITRRWVINNLGIIALVLTVLDFAFIYIMQNYYYSASQQYLNTKISSVTGVLSRYAQDADINFSSEMRSTIENFSDKDKMELMAINSRGRVALTSSGFTPAEGAAMPDYEAVMDGGDGYWVGKQGGETIMAVSVDISGIQRHSGGGFSGTDPEHSEFLCVGCQCLVCRRSAAAGGDRTVFHTLYCPSH